MPFFDLIIRWPSRQILGENLTAWAIGFSNHMLSRRIFALKDCIRRPIKFFKTRSENLKLGVGSHKNQPERVANSHCATHRCLQDKGDFWPLCKYHFGRKCKNRFVFIFILETVPTFPSTFFTLYATRGGKCKDRCLSIVMPERSLYFRPGLICHSGRKGEDRCVLILMLQRSLYFRPGLWPYMPPAGGNIPVSAVVFILILKRSFYFRPYFGPYVPLGAEM